VVHHNTPYSLDFFSQETIHLISRNEGSIILKVFYIQNIMLSYIGGSLRLYSSKERFFKALDLHIFLKTNNHFGRSYDHAMSNPFIVFHEDGSDLIFIFICIRV
jgi:hypothetical protein